MHGHDIHPARIPRLHLCVLACAFVGSRALYYAAGARFNDCDLDMWHFIAPDLLRHRLLESVFYLHFQPPLYNLYLGVMLQTFGAHATLAFAISYHLLGLGFAFGLLALMRACGAGARTALVLSVLLVVSPALLLFESFLLYSFPTMAALTLATLALYHAARRERGRDWLLVFGLLAAVVLTRALFHPAWLVLIAAGALALRPRDRRKIALGAAVPLLIVALWCAKNWVVFDTVGTSSWTGFSLARMTVRNLPADVRDRWIAEHAISPLSSIRPPGTLDEYARFMPLPAATGIPVLDQRTKPGGAINLHHLAYVEISRQLGKDALYALRHRPDVYATSALEALRLFVSPTSDWHGVARDRAQIANYARAYAAVVHFPSVLGRSGLILPALALLLPFGALAARRALRRDRYDPIGMTLAFMATTGVYVTLTGCLLEPRENMRFRLLIEPLLWVLLGVAIAHARAWLRARSRTASERGVPEAAQRKT